MPKKTDIKNDTSPSDPLLDSIQQEEIKKDNQSQTNEISMSARLLFPWIRCTVVPGRHDVKITMMNEVAGMIPLGKNRQTIPYRNISSISASTAARTDYILFGILMIAAAVYSFGFLHVPFHIPLGIILVLLGLISILLSLDYRLKIGRGGDDLIIRVPFYEGKKLLAIKDRLERELEAFQSRMETRQNEEELK